MIKKNYKDVKSKQATLTDGTPVENVFVRWLIDENDGAHNFAMRRFEIKPKTKVPLHNHLQDHEIYILSGDGKFYNDSGQEEIVSSGDVVYIPPNENHAIENISKSELVFLCLIPYLKQEEEKPKIIPNE
ncbi:MAG: cupin domain-containing protein [Candidatus Thorarchaeota archaeon]